MAGKKRKPLPKKDYRPLRSEVGRWILEEDCSGVKVLNFPGGRNLINKGSSQYKITDNEIAIIKGILVENNRVCDEDMSQVIIKNGRMKIERVVDSGWVCITIDDRPFKINVLSARSNIPLNLNHDTATTELLYVNSEYEDGFPMTYFGRVSSAEVVDNKRIDTWLNELIRSDNFEVHLQLKRWRLERMNETGKSMVLGYMKSDPERVFVQTGDLYIQFISFSAYMDSLKEGFTIGTCTPEFLANAERFSEGKEIVNGTSWALSEAETLGVMDILTTPISESTRLHLETATRSVVSLTEMTGEISYKRMPRLRHNAVLYNSDKKILHGSDSTILSFLQNEISTIQVFEYGANTNYVFNVLHRSNVRVETYSVRDLNNCHTSDEYITFFRDFKSTFPNSVDRSHINNQNGQLARLRHDCLYSFACRCLGMIMQEDDTKIRDSLFPIVSHLYDVGKPRDAINLTSVIRNLRADGVANKSPDIVFYDDITGTLVIGDVAVVYEVASKKLDKIASYKIIVDLLNEGGIKCEFFPMVVYCKSPLSGLKEIERKYPIFKDITEVSKVIERITESIEARGGFNASKYGESPMEDMLSVDYASEKLSRHLISILRENNVEMGNYGDKEFIEDLTTFNLAAESKEFENHLPSTDLSHYADLRVMVNENLKRVEQELGEYLTEGNSEFPHLISEDFTDVLPEVPTHLTEKNIRMAESIGNDVDWNRNPCIDMGRKTIFTRSSKKGVYSANLNSSNGPTFNASIRFEIGATAVHMRQKREMTKIPKAMMQQVGKKLDAAVAKALVTGDMEGIRKCIELMRTQGRPRANWTDRNKLEEMRKMLNKEADEKMRTIFRDVKDRYETIVDTLEEASDVMIENGCTDELFERVQSTRKYNFDIPASNMDNSINLHNLRIKDAIRMKVSENYDPKLEELSKDLFGEFEDLVEPKYMGRMEKEYKKSSVLGGIKIRNKEWRFMQILGDTCRNMLTQRLNKSVFIINYGSNGYWIVSPVQGDGNTMLVQEVVFSRSGKFSGNLSFTVKGLQFHIGISHPYQIRPDTISRLANITQGLPMAISQMHANATACRMTDIERHIMSALCWCTITNSSRDAGNILSGASTAAQFQASMGCENLKQIEKEFEFVSKMYLSKIMKAVLNLRLAVGSVDARRVVASKAHEKEYMVSHWLFPSYRASSYIMNSNEITVLRGLVGVLKDRKKAPAIKEVSMATISAHVAHVAAKGQQKGWRRSKGEMVDLLTGKGCHGDFLPMTVHAAVKQLEVLCQTPSFLHSSKFRDLNPEMSIMDILTTKQGLRVVTTEVPSEDKGRGGKRYAKEIYKEKKLLTFLRNENKTVREHIADDLKEELDRSYFLIENKGQITSVDREYFMGTTSQTTSMVTEKLCRGMGSFDPGNLLSAGGNNAKTILRVLRDNMDEISKYSTGTPESLSVVIDMSKYSTRYPVNFMALALLRMLESKKIPKGLSCLLAKNFLSNVHRTVLMPKIVHDSLFNEDSTYTCGEKVLLQSAFKVLPGFTEKCRGLETDAGWCQGNMNSQCGFFTSLINAYMMKEILRKDLELEENHLEASADLEELQKALAGEESSYQLKSRKPGDGRDKNAIRGQFKLTHGESDLAIDRGIMKLMETLQNSKIRNKVAIASFTFADDQGHSILKSSSSSSKLLTKARQMIMGILTGGGLVINAKKSYTSVCNEIVGNTIVPHRITEHPSRSLIPTLLSYSSGGEPCNLTVRLDEFRKAAYAGMEVIKMVFASQLIQEEFLRRFPDIQADPKIVKMLPIWFGGDPYDIDAICLLGSNCGAMRAIEACSTKEGRNAYMNILVAKSSLSDEGGMTGDEVAKLTMGEYSRTPLVQTALIGPFPLSMKPPDERTKDVIAELMMKGVSNSPNKRRDLRLQIDTTLDKYPLLSLAGPLFKHNVITDQYKPIFFSLPSIIVALGPNTNDPSRVCKESVMSLNANVYQYNPKTPAVRNAAMLSYTRSQIEKQRKEIAQLNEEIELAKIRGVRIQKRGDDQKRHLSSISSCNVLEGARKDEEGKIVDACIVVQDRIRNYTKLEEWYNSSEDLKTQEDIEYLSMMVTKNEVEALRSMYPMGPTHRETIKYLYNRCSNNMVNENCGYKCTLQQVVEDVIHHEYKPKDDMLWDVQTLLKKMYEVQLNLFHEYSSRTFTSDAKLGWELEYDYPNVSDYVKVTRPESKLALHCQRPIRALIEMFDPNLRSLLVDLGIYEGTGSEATYQDQMTITRTIEAAGLTGSSKVMQSRFILDMTQKFGDIRQEVGRRRGECEGGGDSLDKSLLSLFAMGDRKLKIIGKDRGTEIWDGVEACCMVSRIFLLMFKNGFILNAKNQSALADYVKTYHDKILKTIFKDRFSNEIVIAKSLVLYLLSDKPKETVIQEYALKVNHNIEYVNTRGFSITYRGFFDLTTTEGGGTIDLFSSDKEYLRRVADRIAELFQNNEFKLPWHPEASSRRVYRLVTEDDKDNHLDYVLLHDKENNRLSIELKRDRVGREYYVDLVVRNPRAADCGLTMTDTGMWLRGKRVVPWLEDLALSDSKLRPFCIDYADGRFKLEASTVGFMRLNQGTLIEHFNYPMLREGDLIDVMDNILAISMQTLWEEAAIDQQEGAIAPILVPDYDSRKDDILRLLVGAVDNRYSPVAILLALLRGSGMEEEKAKAWIADTANKRTSVDNISLQWIAKLYDCNSYSTHRLVLLLRILVKEGIPDGKYAGHTMNLFSIIKMLVPKQLERVDRMDKYMEQVSRIARVFK